MSKSKVRFKISVLVERVDFDSEQCCLRVTGKNNEENDYIKMGQYHTIDIELHQPFRLEKPCWDIVYIDRLKEASDPGAKADVACIVIQEGLAHVCLVTRAMTVTKSRIERRIPKKAGGVQYEKAMTDFFDDIYNAILKHINFDIIQCVLVGSPGFLREDFMQFMIEHATRKNDAVLIKNKSKFIKVPASSGHKNAVDQILSSADLRSQMAGFIHIQLSVLNYYNATFKRYRREGSRVSSSP